MLPGVVERVDDYQRRHPWLGFPLAVAARFLDDRGPLLAALITYYGFLSLFPLLLVAGTTLRLVLHDDPDLEGRLVGGALSRFPVLGAELTASVHPVEGSGVALVVGVAVALYGGLGFTIAVQNAFNQVWSVPVDSRPHPFAARGRGLLLLVLMGGGVVVTTGLSAVGADPGRYDVQVGPGARVLVLAASVLANGVLFVVAFHRLTVRPLRVRQVVPGAVVAAVAWQVLQGLGVQLVGSDLDGSDELYGLFGLVLSLLGWIYVEALVVIVAAEVNAVAADRLWPRPGRPVGSHDSRLSAQLTRCPPRAPANAAAGGAGPAAPRTREQSACASC